MTAGALLFGVCFVVCVVGALATVLARNPVRGALGLLATIVGIAGLFLKLSAQFLAAIQLIVYAGAVVVLFVFVLMLLGPAAARGPVRGGHAKVSRFIAGGLSIVGGLWVLSAVSSAWSGSEGSRFSPAPADLGTAEGVGSFLFRQALVPFELTTALLIVAAVGAIAVARGTQGVGRKPRAPSSPQAFFSGPLMARDAEHPLGKGSPAE